VLSIATDPSKHDVGVPVLATIGGLFGLGATWGTSVGYYRAGRPGYATLAGLGKSVLLGGCLLLERRLPENEMPALTLLGVAGVVTWDVLDYLRLGHSIPEASSSGTRGGVPLIVATSHGVLMGLAGRF
jgi:hypothetical protein